MLTGVALRISDSTRPAPIPGQLRRSHLQQSRPAVNLKLTYPLPSELPTSYPLLSNPSPWHTQKDDSVCPVFQSNAILHRSLAFTVCLLYKHFIPPSVRVSYLVLVIVLYVSPRFCVPVSIPSVPVRFFAQPSYPSGFDYLKSDFLHWPQSSLNYFRTRSIHSTPYIRRNVSWFI